MVQQHALCEIAFPDAVHGKPRRQTNITPRPRTIMLIMHTFALDDPSRVALQVAASAALVVAVLFFMWKLPASGERFFSWAPPLALISAWAGLAAVVFSILLWWLPAKDVWVTGILLVLDPAALCAGVLVLSRRR